MDTSRPGVIVVDLDCTACHGTGRLRYGAIVSGTARVGGKGGQRVATERLCDCCRVVPLAELLNSAPAGGSA